MSDKFNIFINKKDFFMIFLCDFKSIYININILLKNNHALQNRFW
jgi:hypothetical protein